MRDSDWARCAAIRVLVLGVVLAAPNIRAQPAADRPLMTGEHLVKLMGNIDHRTVNWTPDSPFPSRAIAAEYLDMVNGEFVHGYIQAVHDASEGRDWCWSHSKPKPHILIEDVRRHLQQMATAKLHRNASALIVEYWRDQFPCVIQVERRHK